MYVLFEITQSVTVKLYSNCILYVLDILQEENGIAMFYTSWIENFQEFYRFADANSGKVLFLLVVYGFLSVFDTESHWKAFA